MLWQDFEEEKKASRKPKTYGSKPKVSNPNRSRARREQLKGVKGLYLKAKAKIWP